MPDDDNHDEEPRAPYAEYTFDVYREGILEGKLPITTTNPTRLEAQARRHMSAQAFAYVAGGAGAEDTVAANRAAFARWRIVPRMMRPATPRDLRVELFGVTYAHPLIMAPIGVQGAYHADGELGTARACADLDVPFSISTASTTPPEAIRAAVGAAAPLWFQLYWPVDAAITASLLARARAAGCRVLLVTLDTFTIAWRPRDLDGGFLPFVTGQGNEVGFSDGVVRGKFAAATGGGTPEDQPLLASRFWMGEVASGTARRWGDLEGLRGLWEGPIVVKGIQHAEDALLALRHGADGVVVSNHGGRQVDGAVGALEVLPEVVAAVGGRMAVLFDSGVRTGADAIKALCLGAKGVMVGRPVMYGLGIAGEKGARHVLAGLLADLDQTMGLVGVKSVRELDRGLLRGGDEGRAKL